MHNNISELNLRREVVGRNYAEYPVMRCAPPARPADRAAPVGGRCRRPLTISA
jgi:hypothetical protein